jgi:VIT1/CCC1 family predicted Fe2+/Mn2+ transporter
MTLLAKTHQELAKDAHAAYQKSRTSDDIEDARIAFKMMSFAYISASNQLDKAKIDIEKLKSGHDERLGPYNRKG